MSSASPFRRSSPDVRPARGVQWIESTAARSARFAGFWSAVALPFALLGMTLSGAAAEQAPLFVALLLANVAALLLGQGYNRD